MRTIACLACLFAICNAWSGFRCVDSEGKTHVGDTLPPACATVTTYELNRAGSVIRRIEPASASGKSAVEPSDRVLAEARRRDRALLDSYSSIQEIDLARDRNLETVRGQIEAADLRARQLEGREKDLERTIAAYRGSSVPKPILADLESVRTEKAAAASTRARYAKELEMTASRFEEEKRRWVELKERR